MMSDIKNKFGKVAVLMGGWAAEREVSLKSGAAVYDALKESGVDAYKIDVDKDTIFEILNTENFDRAFIALHGCGGEDGVMQSVLTVKDTPYTGSGVLASSLAMDKLKSKIFFQGAGIPTPAYMEIKEDSDFEYVVATLGLPIMVKPSLEGSSIGMTKVEHAKDLYNAWEIASQFDGRVLAEQWIEGKEYTVAILGNKALPVICLETDRDFYDYTAKYDVDDTRYLCPCGLNQEQESQLQRLALSVFDLIGASGWGRVDIMCDQDGNPWVIELNTVPGMTSHSLVPMAAQANDLSFNELVLKILEQTIN